MEVHTYLRHRAETQDVIYKIRKRQKEAVALRYNKGVKQITRYRLDYQDSVLEKLRVLRTLYLKPAP